MSEKKVGKTDVATLIVRRENGDKIVVRGSCFEGEQAVVLKGQVFEARREDGSVVFVVKDKDAPAASSFTQADLRRVIQKVDDEQCGILEKGVAELLVEALAAEFKVPA